MTKKIKPPLRGATKPRIHTPFLKGNTRGGEVADLARSIEMPLLPWQELVLNDMLTVDSQGLFVRKTCGVLVARQSGKTHLARMRILAGLYLFNEKNIVSMSSNRNMALDTFRQVAQVIENYDHLKKSVKAIRYANGSESIELNNGARYEIVAATSDGPRGKSADLLYIDETREIKEEAWQAARPVTRARPNAQTLTTSNAGDAFSTVLNDLRDRALSYPDQTFGWYEYSAPSYCKVTDESAWALANPALGYTVSIESLREAVATNTVEATRTELLCQWVDSLSSPWPLDSWEDCSDSSLAMSPGPLTIMAFDVSVTRRSASLVAGQIRPDGKIGLGILQTWTSDIAVDELKIAAEVKGWIDQYHPRLVCFDRYTTASIASRLENSGVQVLDVSGAAFYQACSDLLDALVNNRLVHSGQAEFIQQMNNCAAKNSSDAWRIVRRKSAGAVDAPIATAMIVSQLVKPVSSVAIYS